MYMNHKPNSAIDAPKKKQRKRTQKTTWKKIKMKNKRLEKQPENKEQNCSKCVSITKWNVRKIKANITH